MSCLFVYLVFASAVLLSVMGGFMAYTAIQKFEMVVDCFTFYFLLYNFAVVGVLSIFYSKGIPKTVTQAYLIATSVIMVWNLSSMDEYATWALLVALAFYDLCAVLTPCGPLKALVSLMNERNAPLPGLLYEADLQYDSSESTRDNSTGGGGVRLRGGGNLVDAAYGEEDNAAVTQRINLRGGGDRVATGGGGRVDQASNVSSNVNDESHPMPLPSNAGLPPSSSTSASSQGDSLNEVERADLSSSVEDDGENRVSMRGNSIKLGLGDFVFYSVLISRASMHGFVEFVTTFLIVLSGLGATLVLLSIHKIPLPALPFSILFGVFFYFMTRMFITPLLWNCSLIPIYV